MATPALIFPFVGPSTLAVIPSRKTGTSSNRSTAAPVSWRTPLTMMLPAPEAYARPSRPSRPNRQPRPMPPVPPVPPEPTPEPSPEDAEAKPLRRYRSGRPGVTANTTRVGPAARLGRPGPHHLGKAPNAGTSACLCAVVDADAALPSPVESPPPPQDRSAAA